MATSDDWLCAIFTSFRLFRPALTGLLGPARRAKSARAREHFTPLEALRSLTLTSGDKNFRFQAQKTLIILSYD
jgi:hypothetical protein